MKSGLAPGYHIPPLRGSLSNAIQRRPSAAGRQLHQAQVVDERPADSGPLQALVILPVDEPATFLECGDLSPLWSAAG